MVILSWIYLNLIFYLIDYTAHIFCIYTFAEALLKLIFVFVCTMCLISVVYQWLHDLRRCHTLNKVHFPEAQVTMGGKEMVKISEFEFGSVIIPAARQQRMAAIKRITNLAKRECYYIYEVKIIR